MNDIKTSELSISGLEEDVTQTKVKKRFESLDGSVVFI